MLIFLETTLKFFSQHRCALSLFLYSSLQTRKIDFMNINAF